MSTPNLRTRKRWACLGLWLIVLISCVSYSFSCSAQGLPGLRTISSGDDPHGTKILFIGNSFTYVNDAPSIFAWILNKQQPNYHFRVASFALPSYTLTQHSQRPEIKDLLSKHWNYVILQDQSGAAFKGQLSLNQSFEVLLPLVKAALAKPLAVMTWADREGLADQSVISQTYRRMGRYLNIDVIPVGDLFFYVQEKWPDIELYGEDNHHPAIAGSYLYALMTYAQIFGSSNLPTLDTNDKNAPHIRADVASRMAMCIREWPSIRASHPQFSEE